MDKRQKELGLLKTFYPLETDLMQLTLNSL